MKKKFFAVSIFLGTVLGIFIAWIDSRPNWDDSCISAFLVLAAAFLCGFWGQKKSWAIALCVGAWIPLLAIVTNHNWGSLIALAPAFIGAYLGYFVFKLSRDHDAGR